MNNQDFSDLPDFPETFDAPAPAAPPPAVTFSKLRSGAWGLRSEVELAPGAVVTVTRRDGSTSEQVVANLVFAGGGVYLYATADRATNRPAARRATSSRWRPCGYPGCNPSHCDECEGYGAQHRWAP